MHQIVACVTLVLISARFACPQDADTRAIKADFTRCERDLQRAARELARFEDRVRKMKADTDSGAIALRNAQARRDYLRSRLERIQEQGRKASGELKVSGATCASCLVSSVRLYCRNGEHLLDEIRGEFEALPGHTPGQGGRHGPAAAPRSYDSTRRELDSLARITRPVADSCGDSRAGVLYKQVTTTLTRADSLQKQDETGRSQGLLDVARKLLGRINELCPRGSASE